MSAPGQEAALRRFYPNTLNYGACRGPRLGSHFLLGLRTRNGTGGAVRHRGWRLDRQRFPLIQEAGAQLRVPHTRNRSRGSGKDRECAARSVRRLNHDAVVRKKGSAGRPVSIRPAHCYDK